MGKLFGTDGVRGIANRDLTPMLAFKLARAFGYILSKGHNKEEPPYFLIGKDTRISSDMLESSIVAGLCSAGVSALNLGIVPTPVVSFLTGKTSASGGVMISASHNPYEDNGIKFFNPDGFKLEDRQELEIENLISAYKTEIPFPAGSGVGKLLLKDLIPEYTNFLWNIFDEPQGRKILEHFKVVMDCANGAAYKIAPALFRSMGAGVVVINAEPDGININYKCGSTHPEELCKKVVSEKADLGLAFDGDADRVIVVDSNGRLVDGDQMMAIIGSYLKDKGQLKNNFVVSTVMSNLGFEKALEKKSINFIRTSVGDRYVLEEMLKRKAILGGEQSGHIILLDYNNTGDAIITSLMLLKVISYRGEPLSKLASSFTRYPQILVNITVSDKEVFVTDSYLEEFIRREEEKLGDRGRIVVRPSGTEPLVRVMVEALDEGEMEGVARKIAEEIKSRVGG